MNKFNIFKFFEKIIESNTFVKRFNILLSIFSILFVARFIIINNISLSIKLNSLILSPILWTSYLFFAISWSFNFNNNNYNKEFLIIWFRSIIGKYLPLKIGILLFRISDTKKLTNIYDSKKNFNKIILEQLFLIFWGFLIGSVFYFLPYKNIYFMTSIYVLIGILLINLVSKIFVKLNNYKKTNIFLMLGQVFLFFYLYFIFNFEFGYFSIDLIAIFIIVSSISLFFIGPPAGIGIREFIYIQFLEISNLDQEYAYFAIIVRILLLINEVFLSAIFRFFNLSK